MFYLGCLNFIYSCKFIEELLNNLERRFPDTELMSAFCVLGLRPISLLSEEELAVWGDESIIRLCEHFAQEQKHCYDDTEVVSQPKIEQDATLKEWKLLKNVVLANRYPRKSTADLWRLISEYHHQDFPNLIFLASLALTHRVHTADCEQSFSVQNSIETAARNRLWSERSDQLMRVKIEQSKLDFKSAIKLWWCSKQRHLRLSESKDGD